MKGFALLFVLSTILILLLVYIFRFTPTEFDDAYMYLRYAHNFQNGLGHSWNGSDGQVYGSTSIFYFLFVSVCNFLLPFDVPVLISFCSGISGGLSLVVILYTCSKFVQSDALKNNWILVGSAIAILLLSRVFLYNSLTGSDTTFSLLFNSLLVYFGLSYASKRSHKNLIYLILFSFLATFSRPDNWIYSILFPIGLIYLDKSERTKSTLLFLSGLGIILSIDLTVKYLIFDDIVPLSFYIKQAAFYGDTALYEYWNPMKHILQFIIPVSLFLIIWIITYQNQNRGLTIAFLIPLAITFGYYFSVVQIMGNESRFYLPSLPFVVIPAILSLDSYQCSNHTTFRNPPGMIFKCVLVVAFFVVLNHQILLETAYRELFLSSTKDVTTRKSSGNKSNLDWWTSIKLTSEMAAQMPEGTTIAGTEIGLLGASALHLEVIDMTGLHDRYLAHHGFDVDYLIQKRPDLILLNRHYNHMNHEILNHPYFKSEYEIIPEVFFGGILVHKNGANFSKVMQISRNVISQAYSQ